MTFPNSRLAAVDPRPLTPVGFASVRFRRIFRDQGFLAPDWTPNPRINRFPILNGGTYIQMNGFDQDTLTLRVEVEDADAGVALRKLAGTIGNLVLPDMPYAAADYGTSSFVLGAVYRTQSVRLVAIAPEGITHLGVVRFSLTFERDHPS